MPWAAAFFSSTGFCAAHSFLASGKERGEERHDVDAVDRILVLEVGDQDLADRRLARLHGALDLGGLEQRGAGMDDDLELAARARLHGVGEFLEVDRVVVGRRIGGRQVPLGLGQGGRREQGRGGGE